MLNFEPQNLHFYSITVFHSEDTDLDTKQCASISCVAFKAPQFWEEEPELWFYQIESLFIMAAISSESTKFHVVVDALSSNVLSLVKDIIKNPPKMEAYKTLKDRVRKHFTLSRSSRLNLLRRYLQLDDKRLPFLLNEMRMQLLETWRMISSNFYRYKGSLLTCNKL
ncbi:transposon Ty3-I Gag-Pol polyprotein [Nephila pilipes]|uniref:Transposon Ty3-I Gag-Pol polyprotein n=1 Tax=Nephila pilipes TaxID=299642 RepID=A0A8X6TBQ6_NEPPI|nr:transposon Ty3-I Gag-Pol polyprotein [Nephila pilipes]